MSGTGVNGRIQRRRSVVISLKPSRSFVERRWPRLSRTADSGFRPSWQKLTQRIKDLRRAERLVEVDAEVLGGVLVFRATRIPIHTVAELLSEGERLESLRRGYARLTNEMLRLGPIYAGAHPLRSRPRRRPWRDRGKGRAFRVPLGEVARP